MAILEATQLLKQYRLGGLPVNALAGVRLAVERGDFVAIVGPSGSGKSTLLYLLGGLDKPSTGEIDLAGQRLSILNDDQATLARRHNVGFIFQSYNLLPTLSAQENIILPLIIDGQNLDRFRDRLEVLLELVGLKDRRHHKPDQLSGGEQQRVAIARALITQPAIVLADEPTGNLDSSTSNEVMQLLRNLNSESGVTLIVVTHDPEVAAFADRIVYLRDGGIEKVKITDGAPAKKTGHLAPSSQPGLVLNGGLSFRDLVRTAWDNLRRRPVRNVLTAAGVIIGIVTLVAMVSFGVGVQSEINRNFKALGLENVFISPTFPEEADAFDPFGVAETTLARHFSSRRNIRKQR